ncbi:MAG TPA: 2-hydroxyacid dehydrogenase [Stellaceae bacterium]|nr:2-hydroxyacid dehydrogenase [Stellaceae bacterium]
MRPEIVIVGPLYPPTQARLEGLFTAHRLWEAADREALLRAVAPRIKAVAVYALDPCPTALLDALPQVEIVACFGIGVDRIDLAYARARGIRVTNTPDVVTDATADLALGLILAVERRIAEGDRFVRRGDWQQGELRFGRSLGGRRLGILGFGRIGGAIARRALPFGMTIAYGGPRQKPDVSYPFFADPTALAEWSEILVVACPGGAATRHLVGPSVLAALGPEGTLINIARGSVVDEEALVAALQSGALGAAGLDVFANEPVVPQALAALDTVVLMPHTGSATHETRQAMGELMIANLLAHFAGRPLPTPVL